MTEIIKVDFSTGQVIGRMNTEAVKEPWVAAKDPDFRDFVAAIADVAESCNAAGGDWTQMVVLMHGKPEGALPFCMTLFDDQCISSAQVVDVLAMASVRVTQNAAEEPTWGVDDEPV